MLTIDYIVLAVFLVSVTVGLFRGFFREALSLATWIVALWAAVQYSHLLEPLLGSLSSPALRLWASRVLMFVLVLIAGGLLNHFVHLLVSSTGLSGTDRVLGMIFGAARGALLVGILVIVLRLLELDQEPWWGESRAIQLGEPVAHWIHNLLNDGLGQLEDAVGGARLSEAAKTL
jgi:membrane protein required for colicin V production